MLIGAHESVAGGFHLAYAAAKDDGCDAIQVFTKNASQWKEPKLEADAIARFREARAASAIGAADVLSHDSYLINLCAKDDALRERSRESLLQEALRSEALGLQHVVLHPGAHVGTGIEAGVSRAIENLAWVLERTRGAKVSLLVENTAAQGTVIGSRFPEIGAILRGVEELVGDEAQRRLGVCIDTCHAFAAGYDLSHEAGFDAAWAELEEHIGTTRIRGLHLNDSQKGLGCKVDRHERVGEGALGKYPFWRLQNDARLAGVTAVLETPPKEDDRGYLAQLKMLRGFVGAAAPEAKALQAAPEVALAVQKEKPKRAAKSKS